MEIFWVDYTDDERFMEKISGNILECYDEEFIKEMIEYGYNFMKQEDERNALPFKKKEPIVSEDMSEISKNEDELVNFEYPLLIVDKWAKSLIAPVKEWSESYSNMLQQYW